MGTRSVTILAFPGVQSLDVAGPFEVFAGARRAAAAYGVEADYEVQVVAAEPGPVTCESGLGLQATGLPSPTGAIRHVDPARGDRAWTRPGATVPSSTGSVGQPPGHGGW